MNPKMDDLRWAVIGFGEVGSVLARHLAAVLDREIQVMAPRLNRDPAASLEGEGRPRVGCLKIVPDVGTLAGTVM